MQINSLNIKNFKKFQEREIKFKPGINVLYGANEAGKTTLMNAIIAALYADPTTRARAFFQDVVPWQGGNDVLLKLVLGDKDKIYEVVKDFGQKRALFLNTNSGKKLEDPKGVQEAIEALTNISNEQIYRSTALIRNSEIARIETSKDFVDAIQSSVVGSGADVNVQTKLAELAKEIEALKVGLYRPAKYPGKIKALSDDLQRFESEYAAAKAKWDKLINAQKQGKNADKDLGEINSKIELLERLIKNQGVYEDATKRLKDLERQVRAIEAQIQAVRDLESKASELKDKMQGIKHFDTPSLQKDADAIIAAQERIKARKQLFEKTKALQNREIEVPLPSRDNLRPLGPAAAVVLVMSVILAFVLDPLFLIGILFAVVLLAFKFSRPSPKLVQNEILAREKEKQAAQLAQIEKDVEQEEKAFQAILKKYGVASKDEFFTQKARFVGFSTELSNIQSQIKGRLGGRSLKEIMDDQVKLISKKKEIEVGELTEEVKNSHLSAEQYLSKRRELDMLQYEKRRLEKEEVASNVRVSEAEVSVDDLVGLEEQIENTKEQLQGAKDELKKLELVKEGIEKAIEDVAQNAGSVISKTIETDLPLITSNRYKDSRVNKDLSLEVFSMEKNDWLDPVSALSSGTVDQIYFLYRLALVKVIEKQARVPLLLDDPFVTFDGSRLEQTRKILEKEAKERQILLFTHDNDFSKWGNLIEV